MQDHLSAEASRIQLFVFNEDGIRTCFRPSSSEELRQLLDTSTNLQGLQSDSSSNQTKPDPSNNTPKLRRIFVVEDVSRNHVAVLGSRLKIPPAFFARHLLEVSILSPFDDRPVGEENIQSFALPFFQLRKAPKISKSSPRQVLEELYRLKANVTRFIACPKPHGSFDLRGTVFEIESCLSYWSCFRDEHDWDGKCLRIQNRLLHRPGSEH
jgi:hypothetical protein